MHVETEGGHCRARCAAPTKAVTHIFVQLPVGDGGGGCCGGVEGLGGGMGVCACGAGGGGGLIRFLVWDAVAHSIPIAARPCGGGGGAEVFPYVGSSPFEEGMHHSWIKWVGWPRLGSEVKGTGSQTYER